MDKFKDEKNKKLITKKKADRINKQDLIDYLSIMN